MKKLKIIVVDDHEFFRRGISMTINSFEYARVVGEATNGRDFLEMLETKTADIVLMDINMSPVNGIEATEKALEKFPDLSVIALTMYDDEEHLQSMIDAGAKGFMLKNIHTADLDRALKLVADGKNFYSEELLTYFTKRFSGKNDKEDSSQLTNRELEILQCVARGLSSKEIAEYFNISIKTVNNHRANISSKTNTHNTAKLIAYALKHNLINFCQ